MSPDTRVDSYTQPIPEASVDAEGIRKAGIDVRLVNKSLRVTEIVIRIIPETGEGCIMFKTDESPCSFTIAIKKD